MKTRFTSGALLAAVTVLGLGIAPALAATPNGNSGYEYSDFWGDAAARQTASDHAPGSADGAAIGTYVTQTSHGTWLFPANPNGGGANS